VRNRLVSARALLRTSIDDPTAVRSSERRAELVATVDRAVADLEEARRRVARSPGLTAMRFIPLLSTQRGGLARLVDDARTGADTGRQLLVELDGLAERTQLRDGLVPFSGLDGFGNDLSVAGRTVESLVRGSSGLWGPLADARQEFDDLAGDSSHRLNQAGDVVVAAHGFLGGGGDRTYLVALQNNSEMRDQGMVLSYVVARFVGGRLEFGRGGSVGEILLDRPAATPLPPGTTEVFGSINPTRLWQSVNATADFALSGRAMVDMFRQATGETVDGVIAIDIPGLASVLRVIGPVTVPGVPVALSAETAATYLLHDQYDGLAPSSDQTPRRERQSDLTEAVIGRLTGGSFDTVGLGRELASTAAGGHLRLWSAKPDEEAVFERTGLGGGPALAEPDRTFHLAVENRTATKLDYYVQPSVRQEVRLTPEGDAIVRTFVVLDNQAPVGAPPSYQLGPDENTRTPGQYLGWVLLWGPAGATQAGAVSESGLSLTPVIVDVGPGQVGETSFETVIPDAVRDGRLSLRLVPQSRYKPVDLDVRLVGADGWEVVGPTSWQGPWDRVRTISWQVRR